MAFIRIWEKRASLSDAYPIEVQLARIARSIMIALLRKKATERKALNIIQQNTDAVSVNDSLVDSHTHIRYCCYAY